MLMIVTVSVCACVALPSFLKLFDINVTYFEMLVLCLITIQSAGAC